MGGGGGWESNSLIETVTQLGQLDVKEFDVITTIADSIAVNGTYTYGDLTIAFMLKIE